MYSKLKKINNKINRLDSVAGKYWTELMVKPALEVQF